MSARVLGTYLRVNHVLASKQVYNHTGSAKPGSFVGGQSVPVPWMWPIMYSAQVWILVYFVGVESPGPEYNSHKPLVLEHNWVMGPRQEAITTTG